MGLTLHGCVRINGYCHRRRRLILTYNCTIECARMCVLRLRHEFKMK